MASRPQPSGSRFEATEDLTHLPSIAEDTVLACLRERYLASSPYTSISASSLVSLNPHKYLPQNGDQALQQYAAEYRSTLPDGGKERLPPHVFRLAMNAYYHMRRTGSDQSILLSGPTGAGKSELRRLAIKAITELSVSNPGKKGSKLGGQVANAEFILESFGHARTLYNDNASRFGKYTELQFTDRGRLAGVKTLDYYLERSRVADVPAGERNFHIFYYLVAGASHEERQHLQLLDAGSYRYLGHRAARTAAQTSDDVTRFEQLKQAFKAVGLSKRLVAQVCQLVAAILHLGNLDFTVDKDRNEDAAVVRNWDVLETVAEFLGVAPSELETVFSYRTKLVKKEICTVFLDPEGAALNRDELAKSLYSLLFAWLNECINQKLCKDDFSSFIGLFDLPGFQNSSGPTSRPNSLDQFCVNFANEKLQHWTLQRIFDRQNAEFAQENLASLVPPMPFFDNSECIRLLTNQPGGLIHIMDDQARRMPKKTDHTMVEAFGKRWGSHASYKTGGMDRTGYPTFIVNHYDGPVTYSAEGFLEKNADAVNPDFVSLLRGGVGQAAPGSSEGRGSVNPFIKGLFSSKAIATQAHPRSDDTIVAAHQPVKPMRAPSTRRKQRAKLPDVEEEDDDGGAGGAVGGGNHEAASGIACVVGDFKSAIEVLFATFEETNPWFVFAMKPNDSQLPNQVETRSLKGQIRSFGLPEMARRLQVSFAVSMTHQEGCDRYAEELQLRGVRENPPADERLKALRKALGVEESQMAIGKYKVFLSHSVFQQLEDRLRLDDVDEQKQLAPQDDVELLSTARVHDPFSPYQRELSPVASPMGQFNDPFGQNNSTAALPLVDNAQPLRDMSDDEYDDPKGGYQQSHYSSNYGDTASNFGSEAYAPSRNMFQNLDRKRNIGEKDVLDAEPADGEIVEEYKESMARRRWVMLCTMLTWWIPGFVLRTVGGMKRPDIRQAWREKLTINLIIWFICGCTIFVVAVLGNLICPTEHVFNSGELAGHSFQNQPNDAYIAIRGEVFSLTNFASTHLTAVGVVPTKSVMQYGGLDASNLFPVQVSALCDGVDGTVSPWVTLDSTNTSDVHSQYHDFRAFTNDSRPDWYFESMVMLRYKYRMGFMGFTKKDLNNMAKAGRAVAVYNGLVYEMSTYIAQGGGGLRAPENTRTNANRQFMSDQVVDLFKYNAGQDITNLLDGLSGSIGSDVVRRQKTCLRNLFLIGKVDTRDSPQCQFATYILLALSIVMVSIIGFKFLAAIHFGGARAPEDHDKFVICQVPCYTEGEESLRRTISSLARLKYDDKRKLLFIVCDGNIVGAGNDRTTPRIVLDILGVDPNLDPEPLSFLSLGEGSKQHNMGKVYSGLYECAGHVVPYVVLAKVGKPSERQRPGNRGKRDSQMAIMHFLNKVHFNAPMNPMELEVYHQIKNVIGVNPTFYEYLFQVDADTTVDELSLNRLVSAMMHDQKIIGACGETEISNAKQSIITMAQVYEYFISHHLAKAFESLFGSITCLPGCFSIYRLRTADTHKPLFISNQVIHDYSENRVDTLHMKNLLHLGEDRYLTTLILKHFPTYKTKFVRDAHAATVAPDEWKVLLSQRRRWINSTIHNLAELVFLDRLCGFCCFSMRFVVFIDLLSTIVAPVTVAYIGYLIYLVVHDGSTIPTLSIVMLAAIYGLQALVFIMRMRWDMVAWMIFYILAIPAFSFFLPLYSFWKMDDFSWGSTRLVMNEGGKKIVIHDEGKFDPKSIPLKSWNDYENELWDNESNHSLGSWVPPTKRGMAESRTQSLYGRETLYDPYEAPRNLSPATSGYDLRSQSRAQSAYGEVPRYSQYDHAQGLGSPRGHPASMYDAGAHEGSVFGGYSQPARTPSEYGGRPMSNFLPEVSAAPALTLGGSEITDSQLEQSIRSICANADLDTLTKKGVRKQLESEYGVSLAARKDTINSIIERVLTA